MAGKVADVVVAAPPAANPSRPFLGAIRLSSRLTSNFEVPRSSKLLHRSTPRHVVLPNAARTSITPSEPPLQFRLLPPSQLPRPQHHHSHCNSKSHHNFYASFTDFAPIDLRMLRYIALCASRALHLFFSDVPTTTVAGKGTVATGRIEQGLLKAGEVVEVVGVKEKASKATVGGLETFRKTLDDAVTGDQVGCRSYYPRCSA